MKNDINKYLLDVQQAVALLDRQLLADVVNTLAQARNNNKNIFLMGNGGSAATASHFAHDLVKSTVTRGVPRFKAIALSDNIPLITAIANDQSYDLIFLEQLKSLATAGDTVIAFSGSGNSPNVVKAFKWAKTARLNSIAFTGKSVNKLETIADICVKVPSSVMGQIEGIHLTLTQMIYVLLKKTR